MALFHIDIRSHVFFLLFLICEQYVTEHNRKLSHIDKYNCLFGHMKMSNTQFESIHSNVHENVSEV